MREVKYLEIDEVLAIHEEMIAQYGGKWPVHDFTLLHSAISRPRVTFAGKELYQTIFDKAAALIHSLILNHPFADGNKRTAITAGARFLFINGWFLELLLNKSIRFTLDIDSKKINLEAIAAWLRKYCRRT